MVISAAEARRTLYGLIEKVNDDRVPVQILSKRGAAVLISQDEYDALEETAYLTRSPANARRLLEGYEQARRGEVTAHELIEPDAPEGPAQVQAASA